MGLAYMLLLGGCTSFGNVMSGSGAFQASDPTPTSTPNLTISGKAINGYLANALVFQDINQDGLLSAGESLTITGIDGAYTLAAQSGPIVVKPVNQLTANEKVQATPVLNTLGIYNPDLANTYYVNSAGAVVNFTGQMQLLTTTGAKNANVTPMSTLVAGLVGSGKYDLQRAEQKAFDIFGVSSQVDYVALIKAADPTLVALGTESQKKAVSFSNFISTALNFYSDTLPAENVFKSLAVLTTENLDAVSALAIKAPDWGQMLSSATDVKAILSQLAVENQLQLDLVKLDTAVSNLTVKNKDLVGALPISLAKDTGVSGVDQITSSAAIVVDPAAFQAGSVLQYAVARGAVNYADAVAALNWVESLSALKFNEGLNTVFVRSSDTAGYKAYEYVFQLDTQAPSVSVDANTSLFDPVRSTHFVSDGKTYINNINISDGFAQRYQSETERTYVQYQVANKNENQSFANPSDGAWTSFINVSPTASFDGLLLRTYYRITDVAGNASNVAYDEVLLDNSAPDRITVEMVELKSDSGIYDFDRYSSKISLDTISKLVANDYQEQTTAVVYQWATPNAPADEASYATQQTAPTQDGAYTMWAKQVDRAGNESQAIAVQIVLDTQVPNLPSTLVFDTSALGRGLAITATGFQSSLTEWGQYKVVPITGTPDSTSTWQNLNVIQSSGRYDVYYRLVDRAGNTSTEKYMGQVQADFTAPTIQSTQEFTTSAQLQTLIHNLTQSELLLGNQVTAMDWTRPSEGVSLVHQVVTSHDASGNVSAPLEFELIQDLATRNLVPTSQIYAPWISGQDDALNLFDLPIQRGESYNMVGGGASDRVNHAMPGDIFLGQGGTDYFSFDDSQAVYGLSFLTDSELDFIYDSAGLAQRSSSSPPVLKIYSEDRSNPDEGGMSIVDADIVGYKDASGKSQFMRFDHLAVLNAWVVNLGAGDDSLYFGGDNIYVHGGSGNDRLSGGAGRDFLIGGSSNLQGLDLVQGYGGDDVLIGGDYQYFTDSSFKLEGGTGNDLLIAGNGRGELVGGEGQDIYLIAPVEGSVASLHLSLTDFDPTQDKIAFLDWHIADAYKGVFVDPVQGQVQIDLSQMIGAPYGSVLNIAGPDTAGLLPETVIENWIMSTSSTDFAWSDLSIDTLFT